MARNASTIYNSLIQTKESDPSLVELNSSSLTAIYRLFLYLQAVGISLFEQVLDAFLLDMDKKIAETPVFTARWWNARFTDQYQFNVDSDKGNLIVDPTTFIPGYVTVDDDSKIINYCSTTENKRNVTIKVAKGDTVPEVLTLDELNSALSYADKTKAVGSIISVVSFESDKIILDADIFYNGSFVSTDLKAEIETNVQTYLNNIAFDGRVYLSKIVDAIQATDGVVDVVIDQSQGVSQSQSPVSFERFWDSLAGYATYDALESDVRLTIENR